MLTGLVAKYWMGRSWEDVYDGLTKGLLMGLQALLILFATGLTGSGITERDAPESGAVVPADD